MLLIEGCTVVDANGVQDRADIAIDGELIDGVWPSGQREPPSQAVVLDGSDTWVIPGLIDLHTHIVSGDKQQGWGDEARAFRMDEPVAMAAFRAVPAAERTVAAGVTTVREVVARDYVDVELKKAVEEGLILGPDVVPAGPGIAITGGHGGFMDNVADGPDATRRRVREMIARGAEVIKIISADGPELTGDWTSPQSTAEEIAAAFGEARRHGRICCAHAMGDEAVANAVLGGAHTIEHGWFIHERSCELMLEHGVALVPTIGNMFHIVQDGPAVDHPWVESFGAVEEQIYDSLRMAVEAGVTIAMGSDCGGNEMRLHGQNPDELVLYVEKGGMTPADAIVAGTLTPARILGRDDRLGTVEPGKRADLVLLGADPLDDIRAVLDSVKRVFKAGVPVAARAVAPALGAATPA
jgi:imidazolonepropionase-like amidohydrolase